MNNETRLVCDPRPAPGEQAPLLAQPTSRCGALELEAPTASILLLTKNEERNIGKCLDAVFAQKLSGSSEVILIDSGSSDRTVDVAARYPLKLYRLAPAAFHHARTRNLAAELAHGEYLVYLAADALPCNDNWLGALLRDFSDETVGAVYGRQVPRGDASIERQTVLDRMYGDARIEKCAASQAELGYRYCHFSTVNCAIRSHVWRKTGFPPDLSVCEDVAIAARMLAAGWKIVYEPEAAVRHSHDFSTSRLFRRYFDMAVVYRRLNLWNRANQVMLLRDGFRALRTKLDISQNHYGLAARGGGVWQDAAKFAGLLLGCNERWLPRSLKRRFSIFGLFG